MQTKSLKQLLNEKEVVVGLMVQQVFAGWIAKVYADAGADFIFLEAEHCVPSGPDLGNLILASRLCGLPVVAKSSYVDRGHICKLLDAGVIGIQLPMSETADQLKEVVSYCKFPPVGTRAAAPGMGNTDYEPVGYNAWLKQANEETTVIAHIESRTGLERIDEILQVPGVDIMFIGVFDLSVSLGRPADFKHPDTVKAIERLLAAAKEHGKIAGMYVPDYDLAQPWIKHGARFFESGGDIGFVSRGAAELVSRFPGRGPKIGAGASHT